MCTTMLYVFSTDLYNTLSLKFEQLAIVNILNYCTIDTLYTTALNLKRARCG